MSTPDRFLRIQQIIGDKRNGIAPIIPVSRSTWWDGVRKGIYPPGRKISASVTVWLESDIQALIDKHRNAKPWKA
jgi:predicted DNA-binding transcriptional regulator AlpA